MRKILTLLLILAFSNLATGQIPNGYYNAATGLSGSELQQSLHNIIKNHDAVTYSSIWDHFENTDKKANGKVWDVYSDIPGGNPPYQFTFGSDQCGNYNGEGDCFNREHSFPSSWFGGTVSPMYTDLFHIYPTDGFVNSKRGNYPFGEVNNPSWTSMNGSRVGNNSTAGYSGVVFEPIDAYKGDLARSQFYMATRYLGEDGGWPGSPSFDGSQMEEWTLTLLYEWHQNDPVSEKEISRNNAIYQIQNNRNPFIDHPEYASLIWFFTSIDNERDRESGYRIYPNPTQDHINIACSSPVTNANFTITDQTGRVVSTGQIEGEAVKTLDISYLSGGFYMITIFETNGQGIKTFKLIK